MSSFALEFPPPEKYKNPNSPFYKFKHLPVRKRVQFHFFLSIHMSKRKICSDRFYDGSIMYNFNTNETKICDIDLYSKNHT